MLTPHRYHWQTSLVLRPEEPQQHGAVAGELSDGEGDLRPCGGPDCPYRENECPMVTESTRA